MTDIEIGTVDTTIEIEPEVDTAAPPAGGAAAGVAGGGMSGTDIAQLRALLRPIIMDLMAEEYDTLRRMMG
ncbi:hypothetical protein ILP92_17020 [Maribius pontilimi]|uniref:Uncharacterized protein n=1 Tax=Palleronia pontilimi TaxID=1964209 RepID=A0A934IJG5_9RHOB|nr:hypothetical protein [Palleronia pontilimi]MBJ3764440.1 hypothetical protein [Palleronia pontilimi]